MDYKKLFKDADDLVKLINETNQDVQETRIDISTLRKALLIITGIQYELGICLEEHTSNWNHYYNSADGKPIEKKRAANKLYYEKEIIETKLDQITKLIQSWKKVMEK